MISEILKEQVECSRCIYFARNIIHFYLNTPRKIRGTKYFVKNSLKCTDSFSPRGREESFSLFLWKRKSHPVRYRRGRWATNNSMCAYKLIRLSTALLSSSLDVEPRRDLRFDPVPIASSSSDALHDENDDDVLLETSSPESEMQANLPHDLTVPSTYASIHPPSLLQP